MSWSESDVEVLTKLWSEGLSISKIGKHIGKTRNAVVGKAHRVGLPSRPSPFNFKRPKGLPLPKVFLKPVFERSYRGNCQWIEGEVIPGGANDEIKCMKPTVYDKRGVLTSWCREHYNRVWKPYKRKQTG
jgi:hypothetical protein